MSLDQLLASSAYLQLRNAAAFRVLTWNEIEDWLTEESSASGNVFAKNVLLDLRKEKQSRGMRISVTILPHGTQASSGKAPEHKVWQVDQLDEKLERMFGRQIRVAVRFDLKSPVRQTT